MNVREAAMRLECLPETVRWYVLHRGLHATRVGASHTYQITEDALATFAGLNPQRRRTRVIWHHGQGQS